MDVYRDEAAPARQVSAASGTGREASGLVERAGSREDVPSVVSVGRDSFDPYVMLPVAQIPTVGLNVKRGRLEERGSERPGHECRP